MQANCWRTDGIHIKMEGPGSLIDFRGSVPAPVADFPDAMAATGLPRVRTGPGMKLGVDWSPVYLRTQPVLWYDCAVLK